MNNGYSSRGRTIASGIAAAAVTAILLSTLVESFEPAQLQRRGEIRTSRSPQSTSDAGPGQGSPAMLVPCLVSPGIDSGKRSLVARGPGGRRRPCRRRRRGQVSVTGSVSRQDAGALEALGTRPSGKARSIFHASAERMARSAARVTRIADLTRQDVEWYPRGSMLTWLCCSARRRCAPRSRRDAQRLVT